MTKREGRWGGRLVVALLLFAPGAAIGARDADAPIYDVPPDGRIALTIARRPVTALSTPGMPSRLYLARALAATLVGPDATSFSPRQTGFRLFSIARGTGAKIGPVRIAGKGATLDAALDGVAFKTWAQWFETDAYPTGDALAGPFALPMPTIRYRLRTAQPGEASFTVPLAPRGRWWLATTTQEEAGHDIAFAFAPQFDTTIASAAAGAAIVEAHGGHFVGAAEPVAIAYGVRRPARMVQLDTPLVIGRLRIARLYVRVRDYGSAAGIADPDEEAPDARDIVVRGKARRSAASYVVYVGRDAIGRCSTILYDKPAQRITLSCAA